MSYSRPLTPDALARREARGMRNRLLTAAVLAVALCAGVGGWGATARLHSAVVGSGKVKVDRELNTLQHEIGGSVGAILVAPGQIVTKSQVLITLDTTDLLAERRLLAGQRLDLSARILRLRAERDGLAALQVPAGFGAGDPAAADILRGETVLFNLATAERAARRMALTLQGERLHEEGKALEARRQALETQSDILTASFERNAKLIAKGSLAGNAAESIAADLARLTGELGEVGANVSANLVRLTEVQKELLRVDQLAAYEAHRQMREIEPRLVELDQRIAALDTRVERAVLRAPVGGTINELAVNTLGQIVSPGQVLATLVPTDAKLVIEFQIAPTDIDQIALGQLARLRFAAFNQRTTPELPGQVERIAAAATTDPVTGMQVYIATVALASGAALPAGVKLLPGMPVEVFVTTAERTPMDYLFKPIADSMARAMTEE
jgi:HlyD family type I secretion membrane fusion protein